MGYKIGLDLGVGSVGWAVLKTDTEGNPIKIENLGSRIFDKAEEPKTGASLALKRREARGIRRRLRRRRHRRDRVLSLLENYNIISKKQVKEMFENVNNYRFEKNVYELRVEGLDTLLTNKELARVLINFVKRRGYKSNSKSEEKADAQLGKLLTATVENEKIMKENNYRTVAEMYLKDPRYANYINYDDGRKIMKIRNSKDDYKSTVKRSDLLKEIKMILSKQKELNPKITDEFVEKYLDIFESQRSFEEGPGEGSIYGGNQIEKMIGKCTLEPTEQRAVKASYTFEYFKLLQDLNHIKLEYRENGKLISNPLSKEQREKLYELFMKTDTATFTKIRKELQLDYNITFNMVKYNNKVNSIEELYKTSEDNTKLKEFQSYHKIRKILDKEEKDYIKKLTNEDLDDIGYALTVYKSDGNIRKYLKENVHNLSENAIEKLLELSFSKTGNLSLKAMKKLIPYLEEGLTYDKAVAKVYSNEKEVNTKRKTRLSLSNLEEEISNPVVKRSVSQTIKVLNAIVNKYGNPESVNIELARELSKTYAERLKIDNDNKNRRKENEKAKREIEEIGKYPVTGQDIIKYRLWKEQQELCIYSGHKIKLDELFTELVDVDHIIPYSVSFDDSFSNKVLVLASENRKKSNRVPLQYFKENNINSDDFVIRAEQIYLKNNNYRKFRNLMSNPVVREDMKEFKDRNLVDTQYLSKVVHNLIRNNLQFSKNDNIEIKVQAVKGTITSHIRKRLGIEKIRSDGDEHHAIDAAIIAIVTPKLIQDITNYYKYRENKYILTNKHYVDKETGEIMEEDYVKEKIEKYFPEPYPYFRDELMIRSIKNEELLHQALRNSKLVTYEDIENVKPIFVSRMPRRKVTGAVHKEIIRGLRKENNTYYAVTKTDLTKLKLSADGNDIIGYPEKQKRDDIYLYKLLLDRLNKYDGDAKKAFAEPVYKPNKKGEKGAIVKKVKIEEKISSFVPLNDNKSVAANGGMIRIDIFYVEDEGYYFVPIYEKDTIENKLPNKASVAHKPYEEWKTMKDEDFLFSLYPNDLIYIESNKNMNFTPNNSDNKDTLNTNKIFCYYINANISTASINVINHDNEYIKEGLGIKGLINMKKYQVGILGDIHEVKLPEKRMNFENRKEGKKA